MIDPTVRPAQLADAGDLEQLVLLEREARHAVADQRGGQRWLAENPALSPGWDFTTATYDNERRYTSPDVLVGTIDEVLIAYLVADLRAPMLGGSDTDAATMLRVTQVWVTPEARELGFGDELLAVAIKRGRDAGAIAVEGQALPGDRHTKNLWERAGIVARMLTTYRPL